MLQYIYIIYIYIYVVGVVAIVHFIEFEYYRKRTESSVAVVILAIIFHRESYRYSRLPHRTDRTGAFVSDVIL